MDPLAPLIENLRAEGRLRVWSLVITAFGDLVQHRGGAVTTARLGAVLGRIGVEPGALRTALSRLDSDGWVDRERRGRTSICRLSPQGLAQFEPATSTIYAAPRHAPIERWHVLARVGEGRHPVLTLVPEGDTTGPADLRMTGTLDAVSDAFKSAWLDPGCRAALALLASDLAALPALSDPLDAAAARMLLIHRWRRIVLRYPEPLAQLMPPDAPLPDPRRAVATAYAALTPATEAWLTAPVGDGAGMPPATPGFAQRFGGLPGGMGGADV